MYWVDNLKIKCMIFLTIVICSSTFFLFDVKALDKIKEPAPSSYDTSYGYIKSGIIDDSIANYYIENFNNKDLHYTGTATKPNDLLEYLNNLTNCAVFYSTAEYYSYNTLTILCSDVELKYNSSTDKLYSDSTATYLTWVLRYSDSLGYHWRENNGVKTGTSKTVTSFSPLYSSYDIYNSNGSIYFTNTGLNYKFNGDYQTKILDLSNYDSNYENFHSVLDDFITYMKSYENNYNYFITFKGSSFGANVYVSKKTENYYNNLELAYDSVRFTFGSTDTYIPSYSCGSSESLSTMESCIETIKQYIETNSLPDDSKNNSTGGFAIYEGNYLLDSTTYMYHTNVEYVFSSNSIYQLQINDTIYKPGDVISTYYEIIKKTSLTLKKESFYSSEENNGNSLKYIDIYFDKEDFQKQIKYELNYNDYNSEIESVFEYELAEISSFEIAYLIKDENGFYKWTKNNDIGVYIDHDTSSIPKNDGTGFNLTGIISLIYDDSVYSNIEQIKVSIGLSSSFKYSYSYYDNSSITEINIDDYYSNMLGTNGRLYRNKQYEKYSVISTKENLIKDTILVEYINTDYHLYLEYFDTNLGSYIDSSMLVTSDYFLIKNRDFEKYQYKIGTSIEKGLYLMNYLYHNNNENVDSYYWFYISLDVEYYNTNYLDESYYYDNTGEIDQNIIQNPNSETDNIKFSDTFRPFFSLVDDLEATRILFNDSFKIIYYSLPRMITLCLELLCHAICVVVLLQMLGWGDY